MKASGLLLLRVSFLAICLASFARGAEPVALPQRIAFLREGNVWVMNADGTQQKQLTKDGAVDATGVNYTNPQWLSPTVIILPGRDEQGSGSEWHTRRRGSLPL